MRKADNLPPYRAVVMKSGSLNFLEPSGPAQACYGRALLLLPYLARKEYEVTEVQQLVISSSEHDVVSGLEC